MRQWGWNLTGTIALIAATVNIAARSWIIAVLMVLIAAFCFYEPVSGEKW
jgi:amino acid transporter